MNRVATTQLNSVMMGSLQRTQSLLAAGQAQLATGKKAQHYSQLGGDAIRALSANALLERQEGYKASAGNTTTTLKFYDANLSDLEKSMTNLRQKVMDSLGISDGRDLAANIEAAFDDFKTIMNTKVNGRSLFGGSQTDTKPLKPETLSDTIGLDPADAFANDQVRGSARVGDDLDVEYGIVASDFAGKFIDAFGALADLGELSSPLTDAERTALFAAVDTLDAGLMDVRTVNGENGRKMAYVEQIGKRAEDRSMLMTEVIGETENADLGQVAVDMAQYKLTLEASYSVFAQLNGLSLVNYLR